MADHDQQSLIELDANKPINILFKVSAKFNATKLIFLHCFHKNRDFRCKIKISLLGLQANQFTNLIGSSQEDSEAMNMRSFFFLIISPLIWFMYYRS